MSLSSITKSAVPPATLTTHESTLTNKNRASKENTNTPPSGTEEKSARKPVSGNSAVLSKVGSTKPRVATKPTAKSSPAKPLSRTPIVHATKPVPGVSRPPILPAVTAAKSKPMAAIEPVTSVLIPIPIGALGSVRRTQTAAKPTVAKPATLKPLPSRLTTAPHPIAPTLPPRSSTETQLKEYSKVIRKVMLASDVEAFLEGLTGDGPATKVPLSAEPKIANLVENLTMIDAFRAILSWQKPELRMEPKKWRKLFQAMISNIQTNGLSNTVNYDAAIESCISLPLANLPQCIPLIAQLIDLFHQYSVPRKRGASISNMVVPKLIALFFQKQHGANIAFLPIYLSLRRAGNPVLNPDYTQLFHEEGQARSEFEITTYREEFLRRFCIGLTISKVELLLHCVLEDPDPTLGAWRFDGLTAMFERTRTAVLGERKHTSISICLDICFELFKRIESDSWSEESFRLTARSVSASSSISSSSSPSDDRRCWILEQLATMHRAYFSLRLLDSLVHYKCQTQVIGQWGAKSAETKSTKRIGDGSEQASSSSSSSSSTNEQRVLLANDPIGVLISVLKSEPDSVMLLLTDFTGVSLFERLISLSYTDFVRLESVGDAFFERVRWLCLPNDTPWMHFICTTFKYQFPRVHGDFIWRCFNTVLSCAMSQLGPLKFARVDGFHPDGLTLCFQHIRSRSMAMTGNQIELLLELLALHDWSRTNRHGDDYWLTLLRTSEHETLRRWIEFNPSTDSLWPKRYTDGPHISLLEAADKVLQPNDASHILLCVEYDRWRKKHIPFIRKQLDQYFIPDLADIIMSHLLPENALSASQSSKKAIVNRASGGANSSATQAAQV